MKKILLRTIISIISICLVLIIYLSTIGIKTNKLNKQISSQIKNINENFEIQLKEVNIILNPIEFKLNLKTLGADLNYKNKTIELEKIKSEILMRRLSLN